MIEVQDIFLLLLFEDDKISIISPVYKLSSLFEEEIMV